MGCKLGWRAIRWAFLLVGLSFLFNGIAMAGDQAAADKSGSLTSGPVEGLPSFFKGIYDNLETEFVLAAGLRNDKLDWSISGNDTNVLSELTWSGVDSYQLALSNRSRYKRHIVLRGHLNYAWIRDGRVRDSDYGQDDRRAEYSRSVSETNDDELWDVSVGGGYAFYFLEDRLTVAPMIGFSYNKQNFRIENGNQVISADNPHSTDTRYDPPPVGPLSDQLNSTYFARWMGPWVGCDLRYRLKDQASGRPPVAFGLSVEIHWADYYGEGNWNLRDDLAHPKSFEHETSGFGLRLAGEAVVQLADHWALSVMVEHQDWSTRDGTDRVFSIADGTSETQLNEVCWHSTSIMFGAIRRF